MLRAAVNSGTGRAAMLGVPNYGETGTSQDNRDALFVGYAGGLVVGVWIGNDDNRPLKGISGGGLPARVWRDFMTQALGQKSAPKRPERAVDPEGPVQPLDVPDIGAIPVGEQTTVGEQDGQAVVRTEINGTPIDLLLPLADRPALPPPPTGPAPESGQAPPPPDQ